ncbi:MAG TPA: MBL fold metallo-hydrolase, partial [Anaerolineales bacterium]|nr:MBL fold metallo-hydrolase [Anaerolineales bacterium]
IVTVSHDAPGHSKVDVVKSTSHLLDGAGEFEIGSVFITGVATDGGAAKKKNKDTSSRNTVFVFDYDGITVAHLGDLKQVPTQSEIESLGTINVALVPVGGGGGLNAAKAAEVISLIEPNIVIPMHYSTPDSKVSLESLTKFIKEMGLSKPEKQPSLKVTRSGLPSETKVIVLEYQKGS